MPADRDALRLVPAAATAPALVDLPPAEAVDGPQRDLLCALGYVYLACGETRRALALLRLVERQAPEDVGALRVLAYALIADGDGEGALDAVERLEALDRDPEARTPLLLLRSHALRLLGRWEEARAAFGRFVAARNARTPLKQDQATQEQATWTA